MFEQYEEKAIEILNEIGKISPPLLMRKLKINFDASKLLCQRVWLRQHNEARKEAAVLADSSAQFGWDAQLDRVKVKNLEKINTRKKTKI